MGFERMDGERPLASEPADLFRRGPLTAGRLYVTDRRVVFESRHLRSWREATEIRLDDIVDVYAPKTFWDSGGMEILTRDGGLYRFSVAGRDRLIDMIHVCKSGAVWVETTGIRAADRPPPLPPLSLADPAIQPGPSVEGTARPKQT